MIDNKSIQLGDFGLTFSRDTSPFLTVDIVLSVMWIIIHDHANLPISSLYKCACKSGSPRWKVASAKTSSNSWQEAKGQTGKDDWCYSKTEGYTFIPWPFVSGFHTLSALTVSLINSAAAYRPGPADSPNDLSTQSVSIIPPTPRPAFSSSHLDKSLDVAGQLSRGHFLSWWCGIYYCTCCTCTISLPSDYTGMCHRTRSAMPLIVPIPIFLKNKKQHENWFQVSLLSSNVISQRLNEATPLTHFGPNSTGL